MTANEIKKALYTQKPEAWFTNVKKDGILYETLVADEARERFIIKFRIPFNDIGDAEFKPRMDAKLLIRWIVPMNDYVVDESH